MPRDVYDGARDGSQKRTTDMRPQDFVVLNLDWRQMGIGGDTSWGAPVHPEYTLPARPYAYSFRLRPLSTKDASPAALYRRER
jgi:beta-galactosidase